MNVVCVFPQKAEWRRFLYVRCGKTSFLLGFFPDRLEPDSEPDHPLSVSGIKVLPWGILAILVSSCGPDAKNNSPSIRVAGQPKAIQICELLPDEQVAQVLGAQPVKMRAAEQGDRRFRIDRCIIEMPAAKDSVHLEVLQRAEGSAGVEPRRDWAATFHAGEKPKVDRLGRKKPPPRRDQISGIGEEAFWTGHPLGSTLHVLAGDYLIRINGGGPTDQQVQQEKFKALAVLLLQRLDS